MRIRMTRLAAALAGIGLALAGTAIAAKAQTFPDPSDEKALYEAAKKEGTLIWYGGAPPEPMRGLADDFEKKYPGIKVEITRLVGVAQYQRYMQETEAGQYIADVLHVGDRPSMVDLIDRGYIVDWKVPNYDDIADDAKIEQNSYVAWIIDSTIAYNANKLSDEEVKILASDWKGLLDPRFKGRIATSIQRSGGNMATIQMLHDKFGDEYLQKLAEQKIAMYNDVVIPLDRLVAGEKDIALFPSEGNISPFYQKKAPVRWLHPNPTSAFGNTWFGISKFAPHPNAARLWLNWIMSREGADSVQSKYGGLPVLKGYVDHRPVSKEPWYMPIKERLTPDWDRWAKGEVDEDFGRWEEMLKQNQ